MREVIELCVREVQESIMVETTFGDYSNVEDIPMSMVLSFISDSIMDNNVDASLVSGVRSQILKSVMFGRES